MSIPLVYLSRDHTGKTGRRDMGAHADTNTDGVREHWEREAMLTPRYLLACENLIGDRGYITRNLSHDWYSRRHAWANMDAKTHKSAILPAPYIAAHLNAAGAGRKGDYGLVLYDITPRAARSSQR